ncbi:ATP-binding domain-containing protein, partial [Acidimicrobiia bacterium]|nr:ATP-binding domain-containing protein [Acidimicrobiia bacterium]
NLRNRHESEIYNGDTFFIEETTDENFYTTNKVSNCQKSSRAHSQCKKGTLEQLKLSKVKVNLKRSSEASKEVLIMNELIKLEIARKDLDDRYNKNLWLDFAHRNPELEKEKDYEWYQGLRQDPVSNTLLAVHAFTSTVHKAQGDEFKYVLVDLDNEQFSLKWLYTAVTRAISEVRFLIS